MRSLVDLRWIDGVSAPGDLGGFLDRRRGEVMMSSNILFIIARLCDCDDDGYVSVGEKDRTVS